MLLSFTFFFLYITVILLCTIENLKVTRLIGFHGSGISLVVSCLVLKFFNFNCPSFQNVVAFDVHFDLISITFSFGLDGFSILFFFLSNFLVFLCILFVSPQTNFLLREHIICLILVNLMLVLIFSTLDLVVFYVFFEGVLIPMSFLIGIWGSRERKIRAFYLFFFYTLVGSLFMLLGILYICIKTGSSSLEILFVWNFTKEEQQFLWLSFFLSFASKVPIFPFHIWLPEAHVEAPTAGSVLLAGIMLKLGIYGLIRYSLTLFPEACLFFSPLVCLLCCTGVISASFCAIRQTDLKRIIAYSSIAHMNLVVLGAFSFNVIGLEGCIFQCVSHGFVSSAMFFIVGMLYEKYHSRSIYYYGGLVHMMPIYSCMFLIFTMANIALPGTSSFIGEFLLLIGVYKSNIVCCIVGTIGVILSGAYSLWLYNRIIFGNLRIASTKTFYDLDVREFTILIPLAFLIFFFGLFPSFFLDFMHLFAVSFLIRIPS